MKFYLDIPVIFPGNIAKTYDLIVPDGDPKKIPLLVWIHGGGWCAGEKRVYNDFERFTHRGLAVLSIDYRLSQEAPFPAQLMDCKSAIRWARANADTYGYNADTIIVGGSSAGGHLAALMGVPNEIEKYDCGEHLQFSSRIQGVVDEYGPVSLLIEELPNLAHELEALLQNDPQKAHDASPLQLVTGAEPPFLIMHGSEDALVPLDQSDRLYQALVSAGVDVRFFAVPGAIHGFDTVDAYNALTDFIMTNAF